MQETSTLALVLDITQTGEQDGRVVLFTQAAGKIIARAKSLYKPRSKLAAHVQPLSIVQVRLVEKKGVQVVDALLVRRYGGNATGPTQTIELLSAARLIGELTSLNQPDDQLWSVIASGKLVSRQLLKVLGFDPEHASCSRCHKHEPTHFLLRDAVYICSTCFGLAGRTIGVAPALGVKLG